jgi:hypothetical protein
MELALGCAHLLSRDQHPVVTVAMAVTGEETVEATVEATVKALGLVGLLLSQASLYEVGYGTSLSSGRSYNAVNHNSLGRDYTYCYDILRVG